MTALSSVPLKMLLCLWTSVLWPTTLSAQNEPTVSGEYLLIRTIDGNLFAGRLLHMDSAAIVLETPIFPELVIARSAIRRMRDIPARRFKSPPIAEETPVAGTYFVNTSAYGLRSGEIYYGTGLLLLHQVAVGLSDHLSVRGNLLVDFELFYLPTWVSPKFSFCLREDVLQVAVEGTLGRGFEGFMDFNQGTDLSALQGLLTVGSRSNHLTLGGGFSWVSKQWSRRPFFSLSGSVQLTRSFALMTENYSLLLYGANGYVSAFGGRFYGRRVNADVGLVTYHELEFGVSIVPWLGLSVNFY